MLIRDRSPPASMPGSSPHTRARRGLVSELELTALRDEVSTDCVINFDNVHTVPRTAFRRLVGALSAGRMAEACRALRDAVGC